MNQNLKDERDREVFKVLLAYWINHNAYHVEDYKKWTNKLKGSSLDAVSKEIDLAIEKMDEAREHLMKAKILFWSKISRTIVLFFYK